MSQVLHLLNAPEIHAKLTHERGNIAKWVREKKSDAELGGGDLPDVLQPAAERMRNARLSLEHLQRHAGRAPAGRGGFGVDADEHAGVCVQAVSSGKAEGKFHGPGHRSARRLRLQETLRQRSQRARACRLAARGAEARPRIVELQLLNPFNEKDAEDDKLSILDIKARDELGQHYNLEMQLFGSQVHLQRILYYWSVLHGEQLRRGRLQQAADDHFDCDCQHSVVPGGRGLSP